MKRPVKGDFQTTNKTNKRTKLKAICTEACHQLRTRVAINNKSTTGTQRWYGDSLGQRDRCKARPSPNRTWHESCLLFPCVQNRGWWRPKWQQRFPNQSTSSVTSKIKTSRYAPLLGFFLSFSRKKNWISVNTNASDDCLPSFLFGRGCSVGFVLRRPRECCCDRGCGIYSSRPRFGWGTPPVYCSVSEIQLTNERQDEQMSHLIKQLVSCRPC